MKFSMFSDYSAQHREDFDLEVPQNTHAYAPSPEPNPNPYARFEHLSEEETLAAFAAEDVPF